MRHHGGSTSRRRTGEFIDVKGDRRVIRRTPVMEAKDAAKEKLPMEAQPVLRELLEYGRRSYGYGGLSAASILDRIATMCDGPDETLTTVKVYAERMAQELRNALSGSDD